VLGNSLMRRYLTGLLAHHKELQLVMTPTVSGYKRVQDYSFSPTQVTWGLDHRLVGVRADANPYLVAATVLAGMAHGIERGIDPGPPVEGNGYEQATSGELPTQWHAALERAARSEFLAEALGREFLDVYLAVKQRECEKFGALVTDRDYEWYLDTA